MHGSAPYRPGPVAALVNHCQRGSCISDMHVTSASSGTALSLQLQQVKNLEIFDTKTVLQEIKREKNDQVYISEPTGATNGCEIRACGKTLTVQ